MSDVTGLLYSQIGYDLGCPMRVIVRSTLADYVPDGSVFEVRSVATDDVVRQGPVTLWGTIWKSNWWIADFSDLGQPGQYRLVVTHGKREICSTGTFRVGDNLLWDETVQTVALDQLEERARQARHGKGWKDSGGHWRELNGHTTTVIGLTDVLDYGFDRLPSQDVQRLVTQIKLGCDFIASCQDRAEDLGLGEGSLVHEMPHYLVVIPGDLAQTTVALARAARFLFEYDRARSTDYLARAEKAFAHLTRRCQPLGQEGFSALNHGAPSDFDVPKEWMTRDLLMMTWGALELYLAGRLEYKENAISLARQVLRRQVPPEGPEGSFYGHFYTFEHGGFTEKANIHHGIGHDTGGTFPHYILPLIQMANRWSDHPDAPSWREAVRSFAYGYFLPACSANPFYLLPEGYFAGQGLLTFCGPWHGINTSYGYAAALAAQLEDFFGDRQFRQIAVGNIQWIAGLNAGITRESLKGCFRWEPDIAAGVAEPYSQIDGIGRQSIGSWTGIKGTIVNGFSTNPQFRLVVEPTVENDGPYVYTDEDWIPHGAGWLSALSHLKWTRLLRDWLHAK